MINIAIVEQDTEYTEKIKRLLEYCVSSGDYSFQTKIVSYSSFTEAEMSGIQCCFLDTDFPNVLGTVKKIKNRDKDLKIVFIGDCCNAKNIDLAVRGYWVGISGYLLKDYADDEVLNVFSYVLKKLSDENYEGETV